MKRLLLIAAAALTMVAHAHNFPGTKPISFVVPFASGGWIIDSAIDSGRGATVSRPWVQADASPTRPYLG